MGKNAFVFDLDGTLLTEENHILSDSIEALSYLKQLGIIVGIASSRSRVTFESIINTIHPDFIISSNGGLIEFKNEPYYRIVNSIPELAVKDIISRLLSITNNRFELAIDTDRRHLWNYVENPSINDSRWINTEYLDIHKYEGDALKICIKTYNDGINKYFMEKYPEYTYFKYSDDSWLQITNPKGKKDIALKTVCRKLNIKTKNIVAFGDDYTDLEMLNLCGYGVAMSNAPKEVKSAANYILDKSSVHISDFIIDYLSTRFYEQ